MLTINFTDADGAPYSATLPHGSSIKVLKEWYAERKPTEEGRGLVVSNGKGTILKDKKILDGREDHLILIEAKKGSLSVRTPNGSKTFKIECLETDSGLDLKRRYRRLAGVPANQQVDILYAGEKCEFLKALKDGELLGPLMERGDVVVATESPLIPFRHVDGSEVNVKVGPDDSIETVKARVAAALKTRPEEIVILVDGTRLLTNDDIQTKLYGSTADFTKYPPRVATLNLRAGAGAEARVLARHIMNPATEPAAAAAWERK